MSQNKQFVALDIGAARVGVAVADDAVKIAIPYDTLEMDEENFSRQVEELVHKTEADVIVVGYPRNQSGEDTAQTQYVITMANQLTANGMEIVFQDESLTSVMAEERLKSRNGPYKKADIDAEAAVIILQDYLEKQV